MNKGEVLFVCVFWLIMYGLWNKRVEDQACLLCCLLELWKFKLQVFPGPWSMSKCYLYIGDVSDYYC